MEVEGHSHIVALNKSDLGSFVPSRLEREDCVDSNCSGIFSVSAQTEMGLEDLRAGILHPFVNGMSHSDGLLITNARHHDLLLRTISGIQTSRDLLRNRSTEELILVGLHNALRLLDELTGHTTSNDVLGQIFATFCIGK